MSKLRTIIRHEYLKRVGTWAFVISTVLGPLLIIGLPAIPIFLSTLDLRESTRLAVVDQSGKLYDRLYREMVGRRSGKEDADGSPSYQLEKVEPSGSIEDTRTSLTARVRKGELDGFVLIPSDVLNSGKIEHYGRSVEDFAANLRLDEFLSRALIDQRLDEANIDAGLVRRLTSDVNTRRVKISDQGEEDESGGRFFIVIGLGFLLMVTLLSYGGMILSAVTEEKETRIVEMLFYSVHSFPLMIGKLLGVSLVAFTQYAIWALLVVALVFLGSDAVSGVAPEFNFPSLPPLFIAYFVLFFLTGYFVYAAIYALIGAISTSPEHAQTFAIPATTPLVLAFSLVVPVIRSPDSSLSFWISMVPFLSPISMPVRIVTQTPPFWQIAVSLAIGVLTVVVLTFVASRVYRVGMLMYGKRISIPEVLRWVRQA